MQSLPYHIFVHLVRVGDLRGRDLVALTQTCQALWNHSNSSRHEKSQYLFWWLLDKIGVDSECSLIAPRRLYIQYFIKDERLLTSVKQKLKVTSTLSSMMILGALSIRYHDADESPISGVGHLKDPLDLDELLYFLSPIQCEKSYYSFLGSCPLTIETVYTNPEFVNMYDDLRDVREYLYDIRNLISKQCKGAFKEDDLPNTVEAYEALTGTQIASLFWQTNVAMHIELFADDGNKEALTTRAVSSMKNYSTTSRKLLSIYPIDYNALSSTIVGRCTRIRKEFCAALHRYLEEYEMLLEEHSALITANFGIPPLTPDMIMLEADIAQHEDALKFFNEGNIESTKFTEDEVDFLIRVHRRVLSGNLTVSTLFNSYCLLP